MSQTVVTPKDAVPSPGTGQDRHPAGLYILFGSEMWERFGFYTAAAAMTLYLQRGGFGWSKTQATDLWSNYLMFVYATPLIGGWLADKFLGYRRAVLIGGLFFVAGYALLGQGSIATYYIALGLIFAGNGFFKPNISTMVGNLYPSSSPLKDSAYSIFYMGINVGALLAPVVAEARLQPLAGSEVLEMAKKGTPLSPEQAASLRAGFLTAFYAAAAGMTLGTIILSVFYRKLADADRRHVPLKAAAPDAVAVTEDLPPVEAAHLGDRSGARIGPDRRPPGRLRDRHRILDGVPPKREHDDVLGRRKHIVECLGSRLQCDQPVLDCGPLDPAGRRLELVAEKGA